MMARRYPQPFWRTSVRCWYLQLGKKQIRLSPDREEAFRLYYELMAGGREAAEAAVAPQTPKLVVEILDAFLDWCSCHRAKRTYEHYRENIQRFVARIPRELAVEELKPWHVSKALSDFPDWSNNTKHDFIGALKRAMNWALDEELIEKNPIARVKKPGREPREAAVSPEEYPKILAAVTEGAFRDLIELAWETGARVEELRKFEARFVDITQSRVLLPRSKAKGRRRIRVIYLTARAREIISRLMGEHPDGALLRNSDGNAWNKDAINSQFCRLQARIGKKYHLTAFRKSFATQALKAGLDTVTVAHLMGHADPSMVSKVYGMVQHDPEHMAAAATKARASGASGGAAAEAATLALGQAPSSGPDTPE